MRLAVMDLGTNTFHLLISEVEDGERTDLVRLTEPVKLGQGGINQGIIQPEAFKRGLAAMQLFEKYIAQNKVNKVIAVATSALRSAANGQVFIDQVKTSTGITIELIDGNREAGFIYQGVKASGCLSGSSDLIIDIGGGSVEFIICNEERIGWKKSFEIGAARLMEQFHQTDPVPASAISELHNYLDRVLKPLFDLKEQFDFGKLIGSSGAFETFTDLTERAKGNIPDLDIIESYDFDTKEFLELTAKLISSSHKERASTPGIIPLRVDMIVMASLLTRYVMDRLNLENVSMSMYSLKEGVMAGLMADN